MSFFNSFPISQPSTAFAKLTTIGSAFETFPEMTVLTVSAVEKLLTGKGDDGEQGGNEQGGGSYGGGDLGRDILDLDIVDLDIDATRV